MLAITCVLLLMLLVEQQVTAASGPVRCSAWGDPHVTRFPRNETDFPKEEWCQQTGSLTLVKNKYVTSTILVGPRPYFILDFYFAWFDDNGMLICTINGKGFVARFIPNCGADIQLSMVGKTLTITYKKVDIVAVITLDNVSPPTYSMWIYQDPCLAKVSDGICKTGCGPAVNTCITSTPAPAQTTRPVGPTTTQSPKPGPHPNCSTITQNDVQTAAEEICAVYIQKIAAALNIKLDDKNNIHATELKNAETACVTDVQVTGDIHAANSSMNGLALHKLTRNVSSPDQFHNVLATNLHQALNSSMDACHEAAQEVYQTILACNTTSPKCVPECKNNGTCIGQNNCSCPSDFTGPTCEVQSVGLCNDNETFDTAPILLITFGSGAAQYSQDTPAHFNFTTTYKQQFSSPTSDGTFSFINSIHDDFGGSWHTGAKDHTGDKDGYMFIVNAEAKPGQFYNGTVKNLCVGLRYELSVYLANLDNAAVDRIKPNVRFEVRSATSDNKLLAQLHSGEIPEQNTLTWQKYGMSFVPTSSTVVLLMISDAPGGNGNDIAIDDIALRVCAHKGSALCPPK